MSRVLFLTCKQTEQVHHGGSPPPRGHWLVAIQQGDGYVQQAEEDSRHRQPKGDMESDQITEGQYVSWNAIKYSTIKQDIFDLQLTEEIGVWYCVHADWALCIGYPVWSSQQTQSDVSSLLRSIVTNIQLQPSTCGYTMWTSLTSFYFEP